MGIKDIVFGDSEKYDYGVLCMPTLPWGKKKTPITHYGKDEPIPLMLALVMGLQHAFAMIGGLITPPLVVMRFTVCGFPFCSDLEQYAVSAALITSGICTIINCMQIPIPFTKLKIGSGILSVLGTSFTFLPIFELAISQMKADGIEREAAYGKMLGTSMVCCVLEIILSLVPMKVIKKVFPPIVTSITVMLIGVALTGTGMKYWGGGVVCAEMGWKTHSQIPADLGFPPPFPNCAIGETSFFFGDSRYIGLGFSVIAFLLVIELFGSIFMKNCNVVLALLFGYMIAGITTSSEGDYVIGSKLADAPWLTFLWVEWFPIGFYAPAVVPLLVAYLVTTVETVGDISAVYESTYPNKDPEEYAEEYDVSIQGGLLSDGVNSILSALFTSMPNTTFSQNNGVIAMTKCASRRAGYACGFWLILLGTISKVAALITSIPDCVIGGMTIFLFSNVLVSGIKLAGDVDLKHSRRNRFILALSMAFGVGVTVWPYAFQDRRAAPYTAAFWPCDDCDDTMKGVRNGVVIFLSTGYCIGTVTAMLLNTILPSDPEEEEGKDGDSPPEEAPVEDEAPPEKEVTDEA